MWLYHNIIVVLVLNLILIIKKQDCTETWHTSKKGLSKILILTNSDFKDSVTVRTSKNDSINCQVKIHIGKTYTLVDTSVNTK